MQKRPRDLCTAAFYGDVDRLRQLVVASGVFTGRWQPPCRIDASTATISAIEADVRGVAEGGADGAAMPPPPPQLITEEAAEEVAEAVGEEEMAAIMAHPSLQRLTELYTIGDDASGEEGRDDGDEGADDTDAGPLLDEGEEEAAEADRQAQQHDLLVYRCLLAEQRHRESVAQRLQCRGLIKTSTTPPVGMTAYGILFSCRESSPANASSVDEEEAQEAEDGSPNDDENDQPQQRSVGDAGAESGSGSSPTRLALQVRWQPSKRSRYGGTLLHWAVLSRDHAMVRFLVEHGVDAEAGLALMPADSDSTAEHSKADNQRDTATEATAVGEAAATKVLQQLTPACMAAANESHATLRVLRDALESRAEREANWSKLHAALEQRMARRKAQYAQRRELAAVRRAAVAQALREEERREAEEAAAAAAAAEEEEEGGEDDDGGAAGEEDDEA